MRVMEIVGVEELGTHESYHSVHRLHEGQFLSLIQVENDSDAKKRRLRSNVRNRCNSQTKVEVAV